MARYRAAKVLHYGGSKRRAGETFEVKPNHERLVRAMGGVRVADVVAPPAPVKKEPEKKAKEPAKTPNEYHTREMTPASPASPTAVGAMMADLRRGETITVEKPKTATPKKTEGEGEKK